MKIPILAGAVAALASTLWLCGCGGSTAGDDGNVERSTWALAPTTLTVVSGGGADILLTTGTLNLQPTTTGGVMPSSTSLAALTFTDSTARSRSFSGAYTASGSTISATHLSGPDGTAAFSATTDGSTMSETLQYHDSAGGDYQGPFTAVKTSSP